MRRTAGGGGITAPRPAVAVEAAAGAFAIAFSGILFRLADVSPSTGAFFRSAYAVPALLVIARADRRRSAPVPLRERAVAWAAGLWLAVDLILWNHSIDAIGAGLGTVLSNTQVIMVPVAAWAFWGERPGRRTLLAGIAVTAGIVLISGVVGASAYGPRPAAGVVFGILTGVAYTGFILLVRQSGRGRGVAGTLCDATAACAVACALAGLAVGDLDLTPGWRATGWLALLAMTSQVIGWLLITTSLARLPAALTAITLTLQPVAAVIFAGIILGESPSAWQISGVVVILFAVLLASSGGRTTSAPAVTEEQPAEAVRAGPASRASPARPRLGGRTGRPSSR